MIHDVDQLLEKLVRRDALNGSGVDLVFDAPTKDWVARRSGPSVNLYLYDIREDLARRVPAWEDTRGPAGEVDGRRQPPRRFRLAYLVTAWTQRPEDEHRLLSSLLLCFLRNPMLKPGDLGGSLDLTDLPVYIDVGQPESQDRSLADIWSALGRGAQAVAGRRGDRADRGRQHGAVRAARPRGADHRDRGQGGVARARPGPAWRRQRVHRRGRAAARGDGPGRAREGSRWGCAPGARPPPVTVGERPEVEAEAGKVPDRLPVPDPSLAYLHARLSLVERRIRDAVERRRAGDVDPDDRFRGLYISEEQVDRLLESDGDPALATRTAVASALARDAGDLRDVEAAADTAIAAGAQLRLRSLARAFGLDDLDVDVLLVALAPDLDQRFERLYGYLHDDVSRRRASAGLALELAGGPRLAVEGTARSRLGSHGALVDGGLLLVEDPDRPFLTRSLRVPDRVAAHLLGDDRPDPVIVPLLVEPPDLDLGDVEVLARALEAGVPLAYIRQAPGASARGLAHAALVRVGRTAVHVDLDRLAAADDPATIAGAAAREARMRGAGLVVGPVDGLAERGVVAVRAFAELRPPVILTGLRGWDPAWSREAPLVLDAAVPTEAERHALWVAALDGAIAPDVDPAAATRAFRLAPEQVVRAARSAHRAAVADGRPLVLADIAAGSRAQNAAGLERLARRVAPAATWDDLVLPRGTATQLREIAARARHRDRVIGEWRMGHAAARGRGVTALFAGDSGTGKTLSAEVLAGDLGLDLYVIDLSTVIDKYIGETEKNLDRIFTEADRVNGVLLFDEADALFGKRSEVKDARDRYANVEVAYLLQRMERFDGIAILTTNMRANVDDAFTRRLDAIVDFPLPEEADRLALWERNLPARVPREDDLDLRFLARQFKIAGGNIRNVCMSAAYFAAADDRPIAMADLIRGTEREYRKLGRMTVEAEFGPYLGLLED